MFQTVLKTNASPISSAHDLIRIAMGNKQSLPAIQKRYQRLYRRWCASAFFLINYPFIVGIKGLTTHCIGTRSGLGNIHFLVIIQKKENSNIYLKSTRNDRERQSCIYLTSSVNLKIVPFGQEHWGMSQRDISCKNMMPPLCVKGQCDPERKQLINVTPQYHGHPNRCMHSFNRRCVEMFFLRQ